MLPAVSNAGGQQDNTTNNTNTIMGAETAGGHTNYSSTTPTTNTDTSREFTASLSPKGPNALTIEHFTFQPQDGQTPPTPTAPDTATHMSPGVTSIYADMNDSLNDGNGSNCNGVDYPIVATPGGKYNDEKGLFKDAMDDLNQRRSFSLPSRLSNNKPRKKTKKRSNGMKSPLSGGGYVDQDQLPDSPPPIPGHSPASPKRNKEFHALFRSVPEDDYLIEDYSCALQKEILVQGRLYISANNVCFNANIFGWVTNLVISLADIVSIEKKMTAYVLPNAILISTLHAKHFFASFLARDTVYELLTKLWRQSRPSMTLTPSFMETDYAYSRKSSSSSDIEEEGSQSSDGGGDEGKQELRPRRGKFVLPKLSLEQIKNAFVGDQQQSQDQNQQEVKRQSRHGDSYSSPTTPKAENSVEDSLFKPREKAVRRRSRSEAGLTRRPSQNINHEDAVHISNLPISSEQPLAASANTTLKQSHPRTARNLAKINTKKRTYGATQCACLKTSDHYANVSLDTTFTGSVETIYNLLFTSGFVRKFLNEEEKCTDVNMGEWASESSKSLTRTSSYYRPINFPIGPKVAKCFLKDECQHRNFDDYITNLTTITSPEVPYGNTFCIKVRTCIMWAGKNEARVIISFAVEFSKSTWWKSQIEKATIDGQNKYTKSLVNAIRKYIVAHPTEFQDEIGSPVREIDQVEQTQEKPATHTGGKSRPQSMQRLLPHDDLNVGEEESCTEQDQEQGDLIQTLGDLISSITSIIFSVTENLSMPSSNSLVLFAFVVLIFTNFHIWWMLNDLTRELERHRLENNAGPFAGSGLDAWRQGDLLYELKRLRGFSSLFEDQVNIEGDLLWDWINEKAKGYEKKRTNNDKSTTPPSEL